MIEHVPQQVDNALLYFHSAGRSSDEIKPFLPQLIESLPNTYLWAGDGPISASPLMRQGLHYGNDAKRYWFTFPMQDASSPESFADHVEAMGATLFCAGAYINRFADQIMARFQIAAKKVVLCGFQHGSCAALAAAMMRRDDPYATTILFEPYILESYYLKQELSLPATTVVCIDNQHIRQRVRNWINIETDREFQNYGITTQRITVGEGGDNLDSAMMAEAVRIMAEL
jgi:predicted esterase